MIALKSPAVHPIGLALGLRSASLLQLAGRPGQLEVHEMAAGELPHDETKPIEEQDRQRAAALRALLTDHHFRGRDVVSCVGSQELFVQNVRLPQLPPEEVPKVVLWEAEERLPYPVADAEVRHLMAGQVRQDSNVKQEVILLACHRGVVNRHVGVLEQAGLRPRAIDVEPCALLRCLLARGRSEEVEQRRAYLNLGERATTVLIAEGARVLFLKYVAGGSQQLDQAVARHLELGETEAARMRATVAAATALDAEDEIHRTVIDAIRGPLEAMGSEIELCLRYYAVTFRGRPIERLVLTGADASPWLGEYLSERLRTPCEIGNPFDALARWPTTTAALDRPWKWTTAMGLSLSTDR